MSGEISRLKDIFLPSTNTAKKVLFYGASVYAENNIQRLLESNLIPVCFIDNEKGKLKTNIRGFEILPVISAIERYPNYEIYITMNPEEYESATLFLRKLGIPLNHIKYTEPYEWRMRCADTFERCLTINGYYFRLCCPVGVLEPMHFNIKYENVSKTLKKCLEVRKEIINLHRLGIQGPCEGCGYLTEGVSPIMPDLDGIILGGGFKGDLCNNKCIYCTVVEELQNKHSDKDLMETLTQLIENDAGITFHDFTFANGEFLARSDADSICEYLSSKNIRISFTTNGTILKEAQLNLIRLNKVGWINISLDSGNRETYLKIKRNDSFDKVVNNLERYSKEGANISIKYIILPGINDDNANIDGFLDIANKIKATNVSISADKNNRHTQLPEQTINAVLSLYDKAVKCGLHTSFVLGNFNSEDSTLIQSNLINRLNLK